MNTDDEQLVEEAFQETDEESLFFSYTITSYGVDYPVDGLVRRMGDGSLFVPTFQRKYVWSLKKACRFVESLLIGLPVPGIFVSKELDTGKLLVIDGQQRLKTLQFFYNGIFEPTGTAFALADVVDKYAGATYKSLPDEDRRRLDDCIIHTTVVKQDEPSEDDSSIYQIFERLNTGGVLLAPQEIRASIYHGPLNDAINDMNGLPAWRDIFGRVNARMRDHELILRFIALFFNSSDYQKPMKEFLNRFMGRNRNAPADLLAEYRNIFAESIAVVHKAIGNRAFRPKQTINAAVFDAVTVGIARRLGGGLIQDVSAVNTAYGTLLSNPEFLKAIETATTDEEQVNKRLRLATEAFKKIT